ncbi:MAP3K epsilon protein kinase 1-like isoform X1 [Olea europaea var. sylvestris]|uniref:MAP3K epsilon protein kinase 1-like isoform X1 n=1 Tax=Olea europaea var. sylvestris TaxID=158386 RepID=UPI000C1CE8F1|nr:MAP3K epsilon protein kinase 1-like isoform X1 [Olea europaea var. sylvestris]
MSRQMTTSAFHNSKTLDNKYMLGDEIGKGAYGRVYKGLDLQNGDFVAIKQVSLENIAQEDLNIIMQEIDLLKNLNHKNIVKYLGSLKTKTHLHIILEYVENGSLANIIKPNKFGPFPESLVAVYIAQVLEGLVYLHEQGVIHRDIKGANILTTKEGLVKLADFGVATKLTEADVNTHSVVGTPYWMAPEVIEMSGVCAASDIWSVGCTVIELLTCVPPYYDLQPMPALFRIVQDEHPPIPDSLSPAITDFLRQCFKKDARHRPDAKTLLSHPWIQNSRRALQTSLRHSGTLRNIDEVASGDTERLNRDGQGDKIETSSAEKESKTELLSKVTLGTSKSTEEDNATVDLIEERTLDFEDEMTSDQIPTFALYENSQIRDNSDASVSSLLEYESSNLDQQNRAMVNGELESPVSSRKNAVARKDEGRGCSVPVEQFDFGPKSQDYGPQKAVKSLTVSRGNELSRFSDTPGDASLDDLFHPLENLEDRVAKASTSGTSSYVNERNAASDSGKNDLATKLRATIAQKQMENESTRANGGDLLRIMMGVLNEDAIDIDALGFEDKLPAENLFHLQAVEFSKLVSSLRPDEPEDVIVSSCQKLSAIFQQRPEQKIVFITQHGLLPLMELLEVRRTRVICSVLQVVNQIIKDNTDFLENACLVGLIPVVMSFAMPDSPREVRMEAAFFLQQLCQSSSLTLQMFIACRGIPILVGFLEADSAKHREMVHIAIDGMWQIFKLQRSTSRNDFCRIAAKSGILLRLINTLYSLNEATRMASIAVGGGFPADGLAPRPRSGPLDSSSPSFVQTDTPFYGIDQPDHLKMKQGDHASLPGVQEPSQTSVSHSPDSLFFAPDADRPRSNIANVEASGASKLPDSAGLDKGSNAASKRESRAEVELKQQRGSNAGSITSKDRPPKVVEGASNGFSSATATQQENVRPLLSLLDKEPPSRHFSGQLEYVRHLTGLEKHDTILPLLHASVDKKTNGLDFLMAEFSEVSGRGRENSMESLPRSSPKTANKKLGSLTSNGGIASTAGLASQTASGVLSGSGVLNARPGSATSSGLLSHMVSSWNVDVAREYLEKVADLLLEFAAADTTVKSYMCSQSLLSRVFQMFNKIEPPILLKLLKCIHHLSTDPHCLEHLQRADAIKYLIPNLDLREGALVSQIHQEVLHALFNLCKINKRRQEQAAENGIIPHLMQFIMSDSPLKQYALPLLCDMAHASRNSREQLRAHGGLDVYLSLLEDEFWSVTALDSIAVCLAHDNENKKVEQALSKKDAVQKLVKFFQCCPEQHFLHMLEPFLKIITKSSRINTTLAVNGLTPLLISRLDHPDAIARLNLLKLIKAVYEHHPRPKQLIVENDLPQKLQNLIEERRDGQSSGGQVLVKQMATSLLKALHINTVL